MVVRARSWMLVGLFAWPGCGQPGKGAAAGAPAPAEGDAAAETSGDPCQALAPPELTGALTVHIAGDSTAAIFEATDPRVGWGVALPGYFSTSVTVNDAARSGRSSKSYVDEGHWGTLLASAAPGDYVLIEFGHNDQKSADPARYTDPATTYRDYLTTYVCDARAAGAFPVLLTPISRRQFSGASIVPTHGDYPAAMAAVAESTGTPLVDMTERTRLLLEELGPEASLLLFAPNDGTHLSAEGAERVAGLVAAGIRDLGLPLASALAR